MLKEERHFFIINELKNNNIIQVSDIKDKLGVTEMTIRRDLKELEDQGILKRIHGGAKSVDLLSSKEFSHNEKIKKNIKEKQEIAKKIVDTIEENETVFLGPGSTIELVSEYLGDKNCKIVTNSLYLFNRLNNKHFKNLILIGGSFRSNTGAFVGSFATGTVRKLRFKRAFIGVNGINGDKVFTYSEDEGEIQKIALDNAQVRYIVADHTKVGREDFFSFYNLDEVNSVISDSAIDDRSVSDIEIFTKLI
ncbi:MAG: DeoR/GlpR family DNA-binding transcription regulator [Anaerococcus sp.]|jgi:DeoR family lactose phosphotransferase system repressor|nr:DeoR/GlpR family DNA-binding transcription regulator [Peptoniphilaceae bacterium]MDY3055180.1 DeoR/GlpR family DNA-binding transcription regulator [Anaerococcus sp.]